jgi:hypothetical protein
MLAVPGIMSAQLVTAALRGAVTDPQGAAVPDAKVTITDTATGFTRTVTASLGPGNNNVDFGVDKNFKITERIKAQFRFEFFNLFNHPSYSAPLINNQTIGFNDTVYGDASGKVVPLTSASRRQLQNLRSQIVRSEFLIRRFPSRNDGMMAAGVRGRAADPF